MHLLSLYKVCLWILIKRHTAGQDCWWCVTLPLCPFTLWGFCNFRKGQINTIQIYQICKSNNWMQNSFSFQLSRQQRDLAVSRKQKRQCTLFYILEHMELLELIHIKQYLSTQAQQQNIIFVMKWMSRKDAAITFPISTCWNLSHILVRLRKTLVLHGKILSKAWGQMGRI